MSTSEGGTDSKMWDSTTDKGARFISALRQRRAALGGITS